MTPVSRPLSMGGNRWAALAGLVLALTLAGSRFHLVRGLGGGWYGISDPPVILVVAAAIVVGVLVVLLLRRTPAALSPLAILLASGMPLVPALTGHAPLLLAPQGAFLALLATAVAAVAFLNAGTAARLPRLSPPLAIRFGLPFVFYLALAVRLPGPAGPQGDEPHYLVMAQSLISDGDLDLADEFRNREYTSFYSGDLRAHTSPRSPRGSLYSIHTPGLPALIAPAYALAGYRGAQVLMAALAAATACLVHRLTHHVFTSARMATLAWAAAAFLPPLPFYAVALYPETPAALAVALFALVPYSGPRTRAAAIVLAMYLPWLHPKLLPLAVVGILLVVIRAVGLRERAAALGLPLASLGLLLFYFERTYGAATLGAAYGPGLTSDVSPLSIPRGLLALFVDRQFGLLLHAPFWALAFVGVMALARERPLSLAPLLLLGTSTAAVNAGFSMWWGGACPPTRFLVPAIPVLAVCATRGARGRRDLTALLAGASLAVVLLAAWAPRALHNRPDGQSALLRVLAPALDLDQFLPSFVLGDFLPWPSGPILRADRAGLGLLQDWDPDRIWSPLGNAFPRGLEIPIPLAGPPWVLERDAPRAAARFDLPPGRYVVHLRGRTTGVARTRVEMRSDDLVLAAGDWAPGTEEMRLPMLLPVGARRLALVAAGLGTTVDSAALEPESVLPRGQRPALPWPRNSGAESYRMGAGLVRVTAIDPTKAEGGGFRLGSSPGWFAVEAPCGALVQVRVRPAVGLLEWSGRTVPVEGRDADLPARDGFAMGDTCVVPVRLHAAGALVDFRAAAIP